jgi:hypothetical protein
MAAAYLTPLNGSNVKIQSRRLSSCFLNQSRRYRSHEGIDFATQLQGPKQATPSPKKLTTEALRTSDVALK